MTINDRLGQLEERVESVAEVGQQQIDDLEARVKSLEKSLQRFRMMHEPMSPKPYGPFRVPKDDATLDAIIETMRTE